MPKVKCYCHCGASFRVDSKNLGKRAKCSKCGDKIVLKNVESKEERASKIPWDQWLRECQQRFSNPPRDSIERDDTTKAYLQISRGRIMPMLWFEDLNKLLKPRQQLKIFTNGLVVWGHIVQANGMMFSAGEDDLPGELVYSLDTSGAANPEFLADIAHQLFLLKNSKSPQSPELGKIGNYLAAETTRVYGWHVPESISPNIPCRISTTMFARKHLPNGYIVNSFMPLVVARTEPHYALPLPSRYWPPDFSKFWNSNLEPKKQD